MKETIIAITVILIYVIFAMCVSSDRAKIKTQIKKNCESTCSQIGVSDFYTCVNECYKWEKIK